MEVSHKQVYARLLDSSVEVDFVVLRRQAIPMSYSVSSPASGFLADGADPATNLVQILIEIQQRLGFIGSEDIAALSVRLGVGVGTIRTVIDFYSFLAAEPCGRYRVSISDNIVDRMQGAAAVAQQLGTAFGIQPGEVSADGVLGLAYTSCTGLGDQGPAALVNGRALPGLDSTRVQQMTELMRAGVAVDDWPADWFTVAANVRREDLVLGTALAEGAAIRRGLELGASGVIAQLELAGLRGRGGAGFATARKWRMCRDAPGPRVVVCNADEGEPGTFKDRALLQKYLGRVLDGMTLCAATVGADQGFIYLRGEYLFLYPAIATALAARRAAGLLGRAILATPGFDFDIEVHLGAGAYVCGEESALIESLEGKRGIPRLRPPFPATHGYLGRPTVVNNVETFAAAAVIVVHGGDAFAACGTPGSPGTKLLSVSGDCTAPGVYEFPFGISVRELLDACGAHDTLAVQLAGAAGSLLGETEFDRHIACEDVATGGSVMVFDHRRDPLEIAHNFLAFFAHESCGFCTPCRVGTTLLMRRFEKLRAGRAGAVDLRKMRELAGIMQAASHCGLGQTAANPLLEGLRVFAPHYRARLLSVTTQPAFDIDAALAEARTLRANPPRSSAPGGGA